MNNTPERDVGAVFADIKACFAVHGLMFEFTVEHGAYAGRTEAKSLGGYISIKYDETDEYLIELEQTEAKAGTSKSVAWARRTIHQHITDALIFSQVSPDSKYFFSHDRVKFQAVEMKEVVASLASLLAQYESIWLDLKEKAVQGELTHLLEVYTAERSRVLGMIDGVIGQHFPTKVRT
jgi:hypothetical protein